MSSKGGSTKDAKTPPIGEGNPTPQQAHTDDKRLTELLTHLIRVGNQLAAAPSVDELCHQAVITGLTQLGFERMSIWMVDSENELIHGTFGTDEYGQVRDERGQSHHWSAQMRELYLLKKPQDLFHRTEAPLYNDANDVVGMGEVGAAALWNGEEVIGFLYVDNLLTHKPIGDERWRIFELYASTLGHLLSLKRTESALRVQEELLSQILDIMPVGVFVLAPGERITRYNRSAQEMWDFDPASIENWSPNALWVDSRTPVGKDEWAGRQALWYGRRVLNQEVEILRTDGTRRVLLNSGVPLRDAAGESAGAVVVNQDITVSKRREQKLEALARMGQALRPLTSRQSVLRSAVDTFQETLHAQGIAIVLHDGNGRLAFEVAEDDYGSLNGFVVPAEFSTLNEIMALDELETLNDGSDAQVFLFDNEHGRIGCILDQLAHNPRYGVLAQLVSESHAVGAVLIGFDEKPEADTLSLIGALADTVAAAIQRGQLYDEVTTQANRLDSVMQSVNFGLLLLDPQQRIVLANQHGQEMIAQVANAQLGEELVEIAGQNLSRFLTSQHTRSRAQEVHAGSSTYEIAAVPVGASGSDSGWLLVIHDVTRDRAIQSGIQQHQRLAAVGQLAAGIAHDFNNIVAVITLYVQMLQRNPHLSEADHGRLNVIRDQAQNASKLIRQILDFSRQTVIERQPVDLKKLIHECIALWERTLPEHISIALECEFEGDAKVLAEASSIQQALTNLAVNARDAMPNGGELRVALRFVRLEESETPPVSELKPGAWYEVSVIDNGMGIAAEHLPHIFDPFFTTKEIGKGTGLGLAQVYGIIQQHGGAVTAQSENYIGTTVRLFFPALVSQQASLPEGEGQETAGEGNETILLVEDNAPAREATSALLEMMGYRVLTAVDGREGLALFRKHQDSIQLVLSDLVMPEMGGLELSQHIHSHDPNLAILLMTGYPLEREKSQLGQEDHVEWLSKPFTVKQLTHAVRRLLDQANRAGH
jgi:PAS domain S-box-containing protein